MTITDRRRSARKIVLIGAGSASFTAGLVADVLTSGLAEEWTIGLVDTDPGALEVARGLVTRMVERRGVAAVIQPSTDRCEVLPGADVVVTTIAVGGRRAWELDVLVPREHGVFHPVGDTTGPGGISRALRQIPPMLDIARDVQRLCPEGRFFNYANPMAMICRAVNKATPASVVGLCHGVQGTLRYLCGFIGVPYDEVGALYAGMNHLTWITHFTHQGEDLWPRVDAELARREKESGETPDPRVDNPFSWDLYRTYGAFPAVLDRHVSEFFPEYFPGGAYYGKTLGRDAFDFEAVIEGGDKHFQKMAAIARGEEPLPEGMFDRAAGEHEALIDIVGSMFHDAQKLFPMNVPNRTIPGIPPEFVVEVPVAATAAGCVPIALPPLPSGVLATVTEALYGVELAVEAALTGDQKLLVQALQYDRHVITRLAAEALADALLKAHAQHLPQFA